MSRISQREARRLRKRVDELEREIEYQRRVWGQEYVSGVEIGRTEDPAAAMCVKVARKLRHAVVAVGDDSSTIRFVALPMAKG